MIELSIVWDGWSNDRDSAAAMARAAVAATTAVLGDELPAAGRAPHAAGEVCLLLTDAEHIRALNRDWRGRDRATNVLSFPAGEPARAGGPPLFLGDVAVAREVVVAEASAQAKSLDAHFTHLVVHGVLHLLGYDHQADADAVIMEDLERRVLARLGIADPYAGSNEDAAHVQRQ
ncbi:MAG: rRNA maturation RNase YbeY [Alphaproteobacteria bacterium]